MDTTLSVSYETIAHFFEATEGNYRNAIYISCSYSYRRESGCGDFLYIPGYDCRPVLLPLADAENFLGTAPASSGSTTSGSCCPRPLPRTAPSSNCCTC